MSVIAVHKYEDHVAFASDSIQTSRYMKIPRESFQPCKLFEVNGLTIGGVGSVFEINMMQKFARTHKPEADMTSVVDFMVEFRAWLKSKESDRDARSNYLIAVDDQVYSCEHGIEVFEVDKYAAIGAGEDFALTALHLGHDVEQAIKIACELSVWCAEPIKTIRHDYSSKAPGS